MTEHMLVRIGADPKDDWDTGGEFHEPGTPHPPLENMLRKKGISAWSGR